jgi:hypothetical protein
MATTPKKAYANHPSESAFEREEFKHLVQFSETDAFPMIYFRIDVLIRY